MQGLCGEERAFFSAVEGELGDGAGTRGELWYGESVRLLRERRRRKRTARSTVTSLGRRTVRKAKLRGEIAVTRRDCTEGWTIGPPAESE